jgi:aspartate/methionine/tyrosine aminotransferase
LRHIANIAEKHNLLVISDEIYEHFVYEGSHFSIGSIYPNTITMNGFSKEFAMTGWRVGYVAGPMEIIDAINELQQYVVMSPSSVAQHAALSAFHNRPQITEKYQRKHFYVMSHFQRLGIKVHGAQGAYYIFFKAPHDMIDLEFVEKASDYGLILVPGRAFTRLRGFVRLSYGANMHTLERGIKTLERIINDMV